MTRLTTKMGRSLPLATICSARLADEAPDNSLTVGTDTLGASIQASTYSIS